MKKADNGDSPSEREVLLAALNEITERLEDLETKKDLGGEAKLIVANKVYATPRENLPEFTILPLRSVRPYSLADMSARILDPDVQTGKLSLGQVRRDSTYRHNRSVRGWLLGQGADLAKEQTRQTDMEDVEGTPLGRGM